MRTHPDIGLRLTASAEPLDLARDESIDVVIAYGTMPGRRGLSVEPLGAELVTALMAPALTRTSAPAQTSSAQTSPAAPGGCLSDLVLIESAVSPVPWSEWCALNGMPAPAVCSRPSFDRGALSVSAAVQGIGVALESTRFAQDELARGDLVPLGGSRYVGVRRMLHFLCYRTAHRDAPKIAAFRRWLLDASAADAA